MNNTLELFRNIELSTVGQTVLEVIDTADPCFGALILGILTLLGAKMSTAYPLLRSWGLRIAAAVFLAYFGYAWFGRGGMDAGELPQMAVRSLVAAGFVLAPLWIVCPVVFFVYGRIRLALAAFLIYLGYAWISGESFAAENLGSLSIKCAIASGLALIVAWIFQPIIDFVLVNFLPKKKEGKHHSPAIISQPVYAQPVIRHSGPEQILVPHPVEQYYQLHKRTADMIDMGDTPSRQESQRVTAEKNRRRQRARLKAELCYAMNEQLLGGVFSRAMFDSFVKRYLGNEHEPEDVEEYGRELESIIHQHTNNQQPVMVQPIDLTDLTQWFMDEQERIKKQEEDKSQKKTKLVGLTKKYTQLAEQILEEEVY